MDPSAYPGKTIADSVEESMAEKVVDLERSGALEPQNERFEKARLKCHLADNIYHYVQNERVSTVQKGCPV